MVQELHIALLNQSAWMPYHSLSMSGNTKETYDGEYKYLKYIIKWKIRMMPCILLMTATIKVKKGKKNVELKRIWFSVPYHEESKVLQRWGSWGGVSTNLSRVRFKRPTFARLKSRRCTPGPIQENNWRGPCKPAPSGDLMTIFQVAQNPLKFAMSTPCCWKMSLF